MRGVKKEKRIFVSRTKQESRNSRKKEWKNPKLEDVSGRVMAQPYIRFT